MTAREFKVNNEAEEDAADVVMFLSAKTGQGGYTFHEEADIVVGGESSASGIQFSWTVGCLNPRKKMLDAALVKLVEDIWRDGAVDMY
jgi:hypothetical protein